MEPLSLTRRQFLELVAAGTAAVALPPGCKAIPETPVFFSDGERRAVGALADFILPADDLPGAGALGSADYIERLLTVFEWSEPRLWLGGPFSGRFPYAAVDGAPSAAFPLNDFEATVRIDRVTERAWRLRLDGSAGVEGGGPNDALLGPVEGLRDLYRRGLAEAAASAPGPLETLEQAALQSVFNALDPAFRRSLIELVLESVVAAPEYGGNRDGAGWAIVHTEGDVQPLGYSLFDHQTGAYRERAEAPVSIADPGTDPDPLDDDARSSVELITISLGGRVL